MARQKGVLHKLPVPEGQTYRLVTISLYHDEVELLEALYTASKARGDKRASRSRVIAEALKRMAEE